MANNVRKISNAAIVTSIAATDQIVVITNPANTANVSLITAGNLANSIPAVALVNATPSNSTTNGTFAHITFDSSYLYVCVANNVWKRAALSSF